MMKKNILTVLLVAMLMASLAAAANALTMADYTSGLTDADYGELFRCKKTTTSGMYGTTTTEHYLLKENCAGQVDYSTDSSKEELGYAFKKKANQNLNLVPLLACEKPEGGGITDVTTSACQSGYNAQNLGYAFKAQGDAPAGLKVKPLYKCLGEPGLVKPREVACGSSGGSIIAWTAENQNQQLPTETTTAVQPPAAQPPAGFDAESCVDDMYTSVLPVMQPDTWNKRTPVAGLSSASEIKQRIVDAEAMIQYLLCRNKCLRTKLGDAFINSNCKPKGSTLPATLVKPPILAGSKVTGKIVAFFKGL